MLPLNLRNPTYIINIEQFLQWVMTHDWTHYDRATHTYVGNLAIISCDNGLSPGRYHYENTLLHCWSMGMDKLFDPTHYNGGNYLLMLVFNLNHVSKRGPWCNAYNIQTFGVTNTWKSAWYHANIHKDSKQWYLITNYNHNYENHCQQHENIRHKSTFIWTLSFDEQVNRKRIPRRYSTAFGSVTIMCYMEWRRHGPFSCLLYIKIITIW